MAAIGQGKRHRRDACRARRNVEPRGLPSKHGRDQPVIGVWSKWQAGDSPVQQVPRAVRVAMHHGECVAIHGAQRRHEYSLTARERLAKIFRSVQSGQ